MSTRFRRGRCWLLLLFSSVLASGCQRTIPDVDPGNELPFGFVDSPTNGAVVAREMRTTGWALDDVGVIEVRVFVDGKFAARGAIDQPRPDVSKAYPRYAAKTDVHGWVIPVQFGPTAQSGPHLIVIQAVDTQGATRDIGTLSVTLSQ